ncbi:uncharacterized protein LOC110696745 [Chenopodium quinoa]|uniref:uncharacterized protein LOC110696745 n=1 Tax=Chenopodium quinoa TaxID=63459 RepID=UPI000B797DBF|nr:uncharacterized protein LOC110696745 [Chenopodium quinoa]
MGELNFFLGLQIKQSEKGIMIHQQKYIKELIKKYKLENSETNDTPMGIATRLDDDPSGTCVDQPMYRGMIGSLLYLTTSRPDISFSVGLCAGFQANPKESHLKAVKRILRYLEGTDDLCLFYPRSDSFDLHGFTDADYAGDLVNRKSTSGMVQFLGPCLVSWGSKKQNIVSLSIDEAEYVAAAACCSQFSTLRYFDQTLEQRKICEIETGTWNDQDELIASEVPRYGKVRDNGNKAKRAFNTILV